MAKSKDFSMLSKELVDFPFPDADFFKPPAKVNSKNYKSTKSRYNKIYPYFIKWAATPSQIRDPKTMAEFEKRWKLPRDYCSMKFKKRPDFHHKKMQYFWNWVFDKYPDVIYAVYQRAINKSTADARIFSDIIQKRLEVDAPKPKMTPFMLVGVPQEKINALFTPESYEEAQEAEVVDESD